MITAKDDPFVPYKAFLKTDVEENARVQFVAPGGRTLRVYLAMGGDGEVLGGGENRGICGEIGREREEEFNAEFAEISETARLRRVF
jgi:hypothetical protein